MAEKDLEQRFDKLLLPTIDNNENQLKLARSFSVLNISLLQREQVRVAKKLGQNHARVTELKNKTARIVESARNATRSAAKITMEKMSPKADEAVITGRVLDENSTGVANVKVYLTDGEGKPVNGVETVTTNKKGNYHIVLPDSAVGGRAKTASYRVVVASTNQKNPRRYGSAETGVRRNQNAELAINRAKSFAQTLT